MLLFINFVLTSASFMILRQDDYVISYGVVWCGVVWCGVVRLILLYFDYFEEHKFYEFHLQKLKSMFALV